VCNLLSTELDSRIRRYRVRFCKAADFPNSKLTHHFPKGLQEEWWDSSADLKPANC